MKKLLLIVIIILVFIGSAAIAPDIFSANTSKYTDVCKVGDNVNYCCVSYNEAMGAVDKAWSDNLDTLMAQEKPGSEMVDEAFENMRTYQCWLEYVCRSVQYSGYANPSSVQDGILTSAQIGIVPGCQAPEDMGLLTTWPALTGFLKDNWNVMKSLAGSGEATVNMEFPDSFFTSSGMPFIAQCMSDVTNKNSNVKMNIVSSNYDACMALLESKFACNNTENGLKNCTDKSSAFVKVETALRKNHGEQRARILEEKLGSIVTKMLSMQTHLKYMFANLQQLDNRYACYPPTC
jgi:hypothetical protein